MCERKLSLVLVILLINLEEYFPKQKNKLINFWEENFVRSGCSFVSLGRREMIQGSPTQFREQYRSLKENSLFRDVTLFRLQSQDTGNFQYATICPLSAWYRKRIPSNCFNIVCQFSSIYITSDIIDLFVYFHSLNIVCPLE